MKVTTSSFNMVVPYYRTNGIAYIAIARNPNILFTQTIDRYAVGRCVVKAHDARSLTKEQLFSILDFIDKLVDEIPETESILIYCDDNINICELYNVVRSYLDTIGKKDEQGYIYRGYCDKKIDDQYSEWLTEYISGRDKIL